MRATLRRYRTTGHGDQPALQFLGVRDAHTFLKDRWPSLYQKDATATPYQSAPWLLGWAQQLPPTSTPLILTVEMPAGCTAAALALARHVDTEDHVLIRPLSHPVAEYVRPVGPRTDEPDVAAALIQGLEILARTAHVLIGDVPLRTALGTQLAAQPRWTPALTHCAAISQPIDLTRRPHAKRERRWDELDEPVTYTRTRAQDAWPDLARLQHQQWGEHQLQREADQRLHAVLDHFTPDEATIAVLTLGSRPAAAQLLLHRGRKTYSLRAAYDTNLPNRLAPGHALLRRLIRDPELGDIDLGRTLPDPRQISYKTDYADWEATVTASKGPAHEEQPPTPHTARAADSHEHGRPCTA